MKSTEEIGKYFLNEIEYWSRCEAFRRYSYGEKNRNKRFRVLCNRNKYANRQGLLSTVVVLLPNIVEARLHGYIPAIDLCRNRCGQIMLQEPHLAKTENAWEYYFTQPNRNISLNEVRQSKWVEEQMEDCNNPNYSIRDECLQSNMQIRILRWAIRQNIHLQPTIKNRVVRERNNLFPGNGKILGVGIRAGYRAGIMHNTALYNGHPMVGSCVDYINEIEKRLSKWKYDSFFLAIDDREYFEQIKKYFGKSCIYLERPRIHYFEDALKDIPRAFNEDKLIEFKDLSVRNKNEDYLVELYLLAQCDGLYASRGTGHNWAYLINNGKYSHTEFMDLGEFHYAK